MSVFYGMKIQIVFDIEYGFMRGIFLGYFCIGKVASTHGIKGTFKIFPTTDDIKRFELLDELIFELKGEIKTFTIKKVAYQKNMVLVTLNEIDNINEAEKYKEASVIIPDEKALPLEEDEYYVRDIYDMNVYTANGDFLGKVDDIYFTAANDVYVVKRDDNPKNDILIPAVKECVLNIDVKSNKMTVNILKGMI